MKATGRLLQLASVFFAVTLVILGLSSASYAFHSGGVAECEGCHTMHNSLGNVAHTSAHNANGSTVSLAQFTAGPYLLQGSDQSSACLNCHQHQGDTGPTSYHISTASADMAPGTPPLQLTPGGDFGWLKKTYSWVPRTGSPTETSAGERHGHNIVASDYGYVADTTLTTAPGGSYSASNLHCSSCHDPHGKYRIISASGVVAVFATGGKPIKSSGSYGATPDTNFAVGAYRLLAGVGYAPKSYSSAPFVNQPPIAVAPNSYNRSEAISDTRVSYGRDMSEWCANCHKYIHPADAGFAHPAGNASSLNTEIAANYNKYVKSGDLTGTVATAYTSLVPFQVDNLADITTLANMRTSTAGPTTGDKVMCLSCHRAHASGWDSMVRFELGYEFMMVANTTTGAVMYPGTDNPHSSAAASQGRTVAEHQKAYYDRPATKFAAYQRVYCNKCHAKD